MKPPTHEQALAWAAGRARCAMGGNGDPDDLRIVMLLHYIRLLEETADKESVIAWN